MTTAACSADHSFGMKYPFVYTWSDFVADKKWAWLLALNGKEGQYSSDWANIVPRLLDVHVDIYQPVL